MEMFPLRNSIRNFTYISILCLTLLFSSIGYAQYVETPRQNVGITAQINGFWEYLPSDYFTNPTRKYPLLVFIHGWGEIGTGNLPSMTSLLIHGVPRVIEWNIFPQSLSYNGQTYSFIVLSPQYLSLGVSVADLDAFLNYVFPRYRVDRDRVYLTGFSNGGSLCYLYAGNNSTYAQKIAAIVPLSPCIGAQWGHSQTIAANNVAVWGIHGSQDVNGPCNVSFTPGWINQINTANGGIPPTPAAVYSLIPTPPGADTHDIFWGTFEQGFSAAPPNMNMYQWMIRQARNSTLPLTLKKFSADYRDKKGILAWTTTNESNTKEFLVQRAGKDFKFMTLASVSAQGSARMQNDYKWVDESPLDGINYYRLQLVNSDDSREYFEIKKLSASRQSKVILLTSNPIKGNFRFSVDLDRKQQITITLSDVHGRMLKSYSAAYGQGTQEIILSTATLPSGSYFLKVSGDDFNEIKKIIK